MWSRHRGDSCRIRLSAAPAEYGLTKEDAGAIAQAVQAYAHAFAVASSEPTRTRAAIATRNSARKAMLQLLRRYAQTIKASPNVSSSAKLQLKLRQPGSRAGGRGNSAAPDGRPLVQIAKVEPLRHVLRFAHARKSGDGTVQGASRPANAVGLQLFCHVGKEAPADPLDARFLRFVSRRQHIVDFKPEQLGRTAFYYARWQSATGETGPWSQVAAMMIVG